MQQFLAPRFRLLAAALAGAALFAQPGAAQTAAEGNSTATAAPTGSVGPSELRNFSLPGTVVRPPVEAVPAPAAPSQPRQSVPRSAATTPRSTTAASRPAAARTAPRAAAVEEGGRAARRSVTVPLGPADPLSRPPTLVPPPAPGPLAAGGQGAQAGSGSPLPQADTAPPIGLGSQPMMGADPPEIAGLLPPDEERPWLVALLIATLAVAGLAGINSLRQLRSRRLSFAGAGVLDAPPGFPPAPLRPSGRPPPPRSSSPSPPVAAGPGAAAGIVSTRLRPWLDLDLVAERLVLTDEGALLHFECRVRNGAGVPALELRVEATLLNAGENQDRELGALFGRPAPAVAGVPQVPPLGEVVLRSSVMLPRAAIREYRVEGRQLFVPLLALNAFYRWSGGSGQTAASFLLGRGGAHDEKMAPFRLDVGPRVFRGLTQRRHSLGVRR